MENPAVFMLGRCGADWVIPDSSEMIPLPEGSSMVLVPGYIPVGIDEHDNLAHFEFDPNNKKQKVYAIAALLPQGFTRTLLPACVTPEPNENLPLLGYAAVGFKNEKIYVAAVQSDEHRKWHPNYYNTEGLPARINKMLKKYPENRILKQLADCSLQYGCFTAQNIFYQRWEGGLPTINKCNANCIGCISESHIKVQSPQTRFEFTPDIEEIVQIGIEHLHNAREGIISFGQGCEGEPSLNAFNLSEAIKQIRTRTDQGTINMNTNGGYFKGIRMMCDAGLDSMRVTIFSCNEKNYNTYHCPKSYKFTDVESSIKYAKDKGLKISLNLLTFPGFTDRDKEIEALLGFVNQNQIDMIQLRNLNFDPDYLFNIFPDKNETMGITNFIRVLKKEIPHVKIGSYSHPTGRRD